MKPYRVNHRGQAWYGESIGVLILDASYPCIPGNVGNASTFDFPVRYEKVKGASIDRLLNQQDATLATPFIDAARNLQHSGVKAITGACGFMALFQQEVAASVDIITANASCLTEKHFENAGILKDCPIAITGMESQPEFKSAILEEKGTLDTVKIENEVIGVAQQLAKDNPDIGSILLECSDLPPYAAAVQGAVNLPVFDFITMINYIHSSLVRMPFKGFM
ncbi:MAG: aspartate/glutamate racemase family protein [Desulfosarcina sp.]|nr:aspartate/glutamate racemase family protein [Desulfosarcina sp.]